MSIHVRCCLVRVDNKRCVDSLERERSRSHLLTAQLWSNIRGWKEKEICEEEQGIKGLKNEARLKGDKGRSDNRRCDREEIKRRSGLWWLPVWIRKKPELLNMITVYFWLRARGVTVCTFLTTCFICRFSGAMFLFLVTACGSFSQFLQHEWQSSFFTSSSSAIESAKPFYRVLMTSTPYSKSREKTCLGMMLKNITSWNVKSPRGAVYFRLNLIHGKIDFKSSSPQFLQSEIQGRSQKYTVVLDTEVTLQ